AESQHGLVTLDQARAAGLSADAIQRRLTSGRWERVHRGVYRLRGSETSWTQSLMAACLAGGPGAVASHRGAAALWSWAAIPPVLEITTARSRSIRLAGVSVHRATALERVDCVWRNRIPLTSAARTLIDLSAVVQAGRLESALECALAERQVS